MPFVRPLIRRPFCAAGVLAIGLVLAGCTSTAPDPGLSPNDESPATAELLSAQGLGGLDAADVIERLESTPVDDRPTDLLASVQPQALVLTDDRGREAELPLSGNDVYVSVAPFVKQTHDCYYHSLTTCLGELRRTDVQVTLVDTADGDVLVDEARQTYDNGFVGLWVPRGIEATLTMEHEGLSGSTTISTTSDDAPTCITDLRLS
ncbi:CueP family metal-binding protein [Serinicoccus kebangsaanensis]|uniref:CueP family metal-binding protein n=1 Tax=Serinicoccus kebangsaanensis TaxID=2602069 RepID=UPI00124DB5CD|nr:CueP family metal-binding protein [Serinicoccus kebangsaanensis]